jgi:hypothetical protein
MEGGVSRWQGRIEGQWYLVEGQCMNSSFFLTSIVPDFARIAHSFVACFLHLLVHLVLILIKSIATKDITPSKGRWGSFHAVLEDDDVGKVDDIVPVPWSGEDVVRVLYPFWTKYTITVTKELNRGRTKCCPVAMMLTVLF